MSNLALVYRRDFGIYDGFLQLIDANAGGI